MRHLLRGIVVSTAVLSVFAVPAVASAQQVVADWEMDEGTSATVMADQSGNGFAGHIGSDVKTGVSTPSGHGYFFSGPSSYHPSRLVTVPDDSRLDPGTGTYAVTIRFKTGASEPNIVQKGQANQRGGYWKLVLKKGWPRCHFRDANRHTKAIGLVDGSPSWKVNDNQWHTVRCERLANGVRVTLDPGQPGSATRFIGGTIGNIDNSRPLSIGGKLDCSAPGVGCDYFNGTIDWITIDRP